jgi:hypothetical protein
MAQLHKREQISTSTDSRIKFLLAVLAENEAKFRRITLWYREVEQNRNAYI